MSDKAKASDKVNFKLVEMLNEAAEQASTAEAAEEIKDMAREVEEDLRAKMDEVEEECIKKMVAYEMQLRDQVLERANQKIQDIEGDVEDD